MTIPNSKLLKSKKMLPGIHRNVSLAGYTTFKIGGTARYFFAAKTKQGLIRTVRWAKDNSLPFFVLGGGSNVLISDKPYNGLAIKIKNQKLKIKGPEFNVEAGLPLNRVVKRAAENGMNGLEWAEGIPGTVGGAVRGNAGAFGSSMSDIVQEVQAYDVDSDETKVFKNKECSFGYKESIFKTTSSLIIVLVVLRLKKGRAEEIQKKIKEYMDYRKARHPLHLPSAGCVFKNPPGYRAAQLIEQCGLKGKTIGGAQISEKHANFIVNLGGARAGDVSRLIGLAKKKVREKFGVKLEEEIQHLH